MSFVQLDRQFEAFRDEESRAQEYARDRRLLSGTGWPTLLEFQRVVTLAAAGSGKSRELEEQAAALKMQGEFAFLATVRDIGAGDLDAALGTVEAGRLAEWQASDRTAWFFIDSVDEAKLDQIRFADAMRKLADGIGAGRPRARIVLSGRYANWEFQNDLDAMLAALPITAPRDPKVEEKSPLVSLLDGDKRRSRNTPETEKPAVVLMRPLDLDRAEAFVKGQGVTDHVAFMAAVKAHNLGDLAHRPVDLGWLVDYWRGHGRFDTYALMLEASLKARLVETDPQRASRAPLDAETTMDALERIGATLVFARERRLEIPEGRLSLSVSKAMALNQILPDWPADHLARLILLPLFDPAGPGRLQLHNDNEGVVRGFLAARWLVRRREAGAPRGAISILLFAEADGMSIVLPSAHETAAWLAIWDPDVAREVLDRDPALLLTAGDPSSLSPSVRTQALARLVDQLLADDDRQPFLDRDTLQRFVAPDIANAISEAWTRGKGNRRVRNLLLQLCELGGLEVGPSLAREALSSAGDDPLVQILASRIFGQSRGAEDLAALARRLNARPPAADDLSVWGMVEAVFPDPFTVADLLSLLAALAPAASLREHGWRAEEIVRRIDGAATLVTLLKGLLDMLGPPEGLDGTDDTPAERRLLPMIKTAAQNLLRLTPTNMASDTAIDAAVRLAYSQHRGMLDTNAALYAALIVSPARRRANLWRVSEAVRDHPWVQNRNLLGLHQIEHLAWPLGLQAEDEHWLLEDLASPARRPLALEGLLRLWRAGGEADPLLSRIRAAVAGDEESETVITAWRTPYRHSQTETDFQKKMAADRAVREAGARERISNWSAFIEGLKADPAQLRTPPTLKPGAIDGRLYDLWKLLRAAASSDSSYAFEDFGELADLLGPDLTAEARAAFKRYWQSHEPTLVSQRPISDQLRYSEFDLMGVAGVTITAKDDAEWTRALTQEEALRAARYATLEFNGFPAWFLDLAKAKPAVVGAVLLAEIEGQLRTADDQFGVLERIARSDPLLAAQCAAALVERLRTQPDPPNPQLARVLGVIARALGLWKPPADLIDFALGRFDGGEPSEAGTIYLGFAFQLDAMRATEVLGARLDALEFADQKRLATMFLPKAFGDRLFGGSVHPGVLPFEALERLVRIAFTTIRVEDDNVHEDVYSPDPRDNAEMARSNLFNQLVATPGRATLEAMRRLAVLPGFPIPADRMRSMIAERAAADAEASPWLADAARAFEADFDTAPRTPQDLQRTALSRLADINHDLHHGDFSQAQMVKRMPLELDGQRWAANELQNRQGRAYTVVREPHVNSENEPDIRLQSNATRAKIPIEIKLPESWTLKELEDAVAVQLSGKYLRELDQGHGILLLIHRKARPRGWADGAGKRVTFAQVVAHLRSYAEALGRGGPDAPQVHIAVIDVTDIPADVPRGRARGAGKANAKPKAATKPSGTGSRARRN